MPRKLHGHIDVATRTEILGWTWDPKRPDERIRLELVEEETVLATTTADLNRPGLVRAGIGDGRHEFRISLPAGLLWQDHHILHLRCSETKAAVPGSPINLEPRAGVIAETPAAPETNYPSTPTGEQKIDAQSIVAADSSEAQAPEKGEGPDFEMAVLMKTGIFNKDWYLATYPDIAAADIDPLTHFYFYGYKEGRRPNPYFDPLWYMARHGDLTPYANPLLHYVVVGEAAGLRPIEHFDPVFYRRAYGVPVSDNCLGHYLVNRRTAQFSPVEEFDPAYYNERYPDVAPAVVDIFDHFLSYGHKEDRNPSATFDTRFYRQRYLRNSDENPFLHYLRHRGEPGIYPSMPDHESTVARQQRRFAKPGPNFEERQKLPEAATRRAKILAYYLPQFHTFPENDEWWGDGFTEWTNLGRGSPRFIDHYQPRIPRDLGFYSLEDKATMRRQIDMAREAGLHGFVFYFYWFNGRRLMERPLNMFLDDPTLDLPFCLMWANENWTRRWDGSEDDVLISQDYRDEDDIPLVDTYSAAFRDPRYIRVEGRPLLMIYRPGIIPGCKEKVATWRALFQERAGENPVIIMSQAFNEIDPGKFGLDGAIEFPPHKLVLGLNLKNAEVTYLDPDYTAQVYSYDEVAEHSVTDPRPAFPLIKTLCPSWDNDARRQGNGGLVIHGSTPAKYQAWLEKLIDQSAKQKFYGEQMICVNAWNEWCEGAYLEPDLHFGSAYLNATGRAVSAAAGADLCNKLLLVGHDAFGGGAQQLLLSIGRALRRRHGMEVSFLLLSGGKLIKAYADIAPVRVLAVGRDLSNYLADLRARGFQNAIVNTSAAAAACESLVQAGFEYTLLIHELPRIIAEKRLAIPARTGFSLAKQTIFAAPFVRDRFMEVCGVDAANTLIMPQGSYKTVAFSEGARNRLRSERGIAETDHLAIGVGYADLRKGFDLFLQIWRAVRRANRNFHMAWIGDIDPHMKGYLETEIEAAETTGTFHMLGFRNDVDCWFSAADVFVLSSREDPYPTVALEAMSAGIPTVAFDGTGGIPDTVREHEAGTVVPLGDVDAAAAAVISLARNPDRAQERDRLAEIAAANFSFERYVAGLCQLAFPKRLAISVVVPNYNYAHHLRSRLATIFGQTYPVHEIIVLDDCSKDDSLDVMRKVADEWQRDIRIIENEKNSGSVFRQWRKAAEVATGDYVWIAEADDESEPRFLERLVGAIQGADNVALAFTDSRAIDSDGKLLWPDHQGYFASAGAHALSHDGVYSGREFVRRFLSERNLILNVSCVVWKRDTLVEAIRRCADDLLSYRMAGDWHLYVDLMTTRECNIAYVSEPLNIHRRHGASVTHSLNADSHLAEIQRIHGLVTSHLGAESPVERQVSYLAEAAKNLGTSLNPTGTRSGLLHSAARLASKLRRADV
jgi:glycosyltransferase involved in cell wall biosynthesis